MALSDLKHIAQDELKLVDALSTNNDKMLIDEYKAFVPVEQVKPVDTKTKTVAKKNGAIQVHAMASLVAGAACVMLYWRNYDNKS